MMTKAIPLPVRVVPSLDIEESTVPVCTKHSFPIIRSRQLCKSICTSRWLARSLSLYIAQLKSLALHPRPTAAGGTEALDRFLLPLISAPTMAADRVHPRYSPPSSGESSGTFSDSHSLGSSRPSQPPPGKPVPPPPGAYVVQIPKDQIYRYPPPENARRYRKKSGRGCCCRCFCCIFAVLVVLAGVAGVLYLVFRPKSPNYSVEDVSIRGFNLTSSSSLSPEFDVTVRAQNPNDKIGIYYEKGSSVTVYYSDVELSNGALPVFYQPSKNFTVFQTVLRGSNVLMGKGVLSALVADQKQRKVPFRLNLEAPVKIKVGAVKTWKITVKVKCGVTVDNLTASSKVVSKECDYSVKMW